MLSFPIWQDLERYFYKLSELEGKKGGSDSSPLISPAVYSDGSTRANKNVMVWSNWCAVDIDDFVFDLSIGSLEDQLYTRFGHFHYLCYSTASSRESHPKFRLVFPLTDQVQAESIKHFWWALNSELGSLVDKQTKDLSRMFYVPAKYPNAFNFIFVNEGKYIDPHELMARWPYTEKTGNSFLDRLPDAWREQIIEHRKSQMDNTNVYWSSYHDCPFWPKKLAMEYQALAGTGWYRKMYQIMVALAGSAIKRKYPITARQISELCKEFDRETGNWYENRPMELEADRALEYVYRNGQ